MTGKHYPDFSKDLIIESMLNILNITALNVLSKAKNKGSLILTKEKH